MWHHGLRNFTIGTYFSVAVIRFFNQVFCEVFGGMQYKDGSCRTLSLNMFLEVLVAQED